MWQIIVPIVVLIVIAVPITLLIIKIKNKQKEEYDSYDFKTKYGTRVWLTPRSRAAKLGPESFENWTESVALFWEEKKGWKKEDSIKTIGELMVHLKDEYKFISPFYSNPVAGLAHIGNYLIEVSGVLPDGFFSLARVYSLFRHEASHFILHRVGKVGNPMNSPVADEHHKMFKDEGLGA